MSSKRIPEASPAKRKKTVPNVLGTKPKQKPPAPKTMERSGPTSRKTVTGKKRSPGGGIQKPKKPDTKPRGWTDRKASQKEPTAMEVHIFESVDETKLTALEARMMVFIREFLKTSSIKRAAINMGVPIASSMQIGMRYFRSDFVQKVLRDSMLDLKRDRKAIGRMLLERTLAEADPNEGFQEVGSHRARVAALELGTKILGLHEKTLNIKGGKGSGPIGIMAVPMAQTRDEWEEQVLKRQAALKSRATNDPPPKEEKSVL